MKTLSAFSIHCSVSTHTHDKANFKICLLISPQYGTIWNTIAYSLVFISCVTWGTWSYCHLIYIWQKPFALLILMMKSFKNMKLKRKMKVHEKNIHSLLNLLHWTIDFCSSAFLFVAFNKRAPVFIIITWFSQLSKKYFMFDVIPMICVSSYVKSNS